jgi:hypothetical protein
MGSLLVGAEKRGNASGAGMMLKALIQPAANEFQFPVDGGLRGAQQFRGFFSGKSQKKAQLYHPAFARLELLKLVKNTIKVHQLDISGVDPR